jgi:hypothetical protein
MYTNPVFSEHADGASNVGDQPKNSTGGTYAADSEESSEAKH